MEVVRLVRRQWQELVRDDIGDQSKVRVKRKWNGLENNSGGMEMLIKASPV